MNNSPLYKLGQADFIKGFAAAVLGGAVAGVATVLHATFTAAGFDLLSTDWAGLGHTMLNAAFIGAEGAFGGYILKNLFSDENGDVPALGKYGKFN